VGAAWNDEDSDERRRNAPKLILAGRLAGSVDGRPVVIEADDKGLLVTAVTFRAAWSMGRHVDAVFPLLLALRNAGVPLRVGVAGLGVVNLLPTPSLLARLIAPGLVRRF
jgi:hypothetical protein